MNGITGIHFLLTYQCTYECDHCFVWGNPEARGTFTLHQIYQVLGQAKLLGTVEWVYFEGGEPFLYYPILKRGLRQAVDMGFRTRVVTNGYWATSIEDGVEWLMPLTGIGIDDLSISDDLFHSDDEKKSLAKNGIEAARRLSLPVNTITIERPDGCSGGSIVLRGEQVVGGRVMFKGRAVEKLTVDLPRKLWTEFTECPHEDLKNPGRVHVDYLGVVHLCQGLAIGNLWEKSLAEMTDSHKPETHPICGPLIDGGPAALVESYDLNLRETYVDACHLCYLARLALREKFPEILTPDQMYGVFK